MALVFLYPVADFAAGGQITSTTGAPHYRSVDEPFNAPDDADFVTSTDTSAASGAGLIVYTLGALPPVLKVNFVTLVYRGAREAGVGGTDTVVRGGLHIGGVPYNEADYNPPTAFTEHRKLYLQNPATVADWLPTDFAGGAVRAAWEGWDPAATFRFPQHSQLHLEIDCVLAPQALGFVRDRLSRESRLVSRPSDVVELGPPLEILGGLEPLTDLALSHVALPPAGVGVKRHQRRIVTILGTKLNLDELRHQVDVYDPRRFRVADFDTCYSPEDEPTPLAQGVARLSQGGRTFTRTSKAWVTSPLDGRIVELGLEDEQLSREGLLLLNQRSNYCPYSSFVAGIGISSGWTRVGTGSNGSAIAADPNLVYFDPSVVPGGPIKVTSGNPLHVADLYAQSTASPTIPASTVGCLWIPHLDVGGQLAWLLQRGIDNWYWNDTSGAWQAGLVWNTLPIRSSAFTADRSKPIAFGSGTTVTMRFGRPVSGGVAGQVNWVGHVQIEDGPYPTPPIVTVGTTAVARNRDQLTLTCNHGRRTWPLQAGSGRMRFKPLWASSEITGLTRVLLDLTIDNGNNQRVFYTEGVFAFRRRMASVNYDAVKAATVTAGDDVRLAWRWTGPEGELGLAPYTLDVWVNGVKGSSAVAPGYLVGAPSVLSLRVGHLASPTTAGADCAYLWREVLPWVLPDDELVDF